MPAPGSPGNSSRKTTEPSSLRSVKVVGVRGLTNRSPSATVGTTSTGVWKVRDTFCGYVSATMSASDTEPSTVTSERKPCGSSEVQTAISPKLPLIAETELADFLSLNVRPLT